MKKLPIDAPMGGFGFLSTANFSDFAQRAGVNIQMQGCEKQILVISDFHFLGIPMLFVDGLTERVIHELVEKTQPDLIFVLGDNVSSPFNHLAQRRMIRVMDGFGIPWAPILGNHDAQGVATENLIAYTLEHRSRHSLFRFGPNNIGVAGNYFVNIKNNDELVHTFFMISSEESPWFCYDYAPYTLGQREWYRWVANGISKKWNEGNRLRSSIMQHIPLPVFYDAWKYGKRKHGENRIGVWSSSSDNGFFELVVGLGHTQNIFAGHDHDNDFIAMYRDIKFVSIPHATGNIGVFGAPGSVVGGMLLTLNSDGCMRLLPIRLQ